MQPSSPVVYLTGVYQTGKPKPKPGKIVAIGCGILVVLSLCVGLIIVLLNYVSPKETGKSIGTVTVNQSGGVFQAGGVSMAFPPTSSGEEATFDIRLVESGTSDDEAVDYRSDGYMIEGPLHLLSGEFQIAFRVADEVEMDNSLVIVLEESVYAPTSGEVTSYQMLPTLVDGTTRQVQTGIQFSSPQGVGYQELASLGLPARMKQQAQPANAAITIRYERGRFNDTLTSPHFQVSYNSKSVRRDLVEKGIAILEQQRQSLLDLGFNFGGVNPIVVKCLPLKDKAGQFVPSQLGVSYSSVELASRFFYTESFYTENVRELSATIGHELMHFAQFAMAPQYAYTKATNPIATLWMDEATATWYETVINSDMVYLPTNATNNVDFIYDPLYGSALSDAQEHGYGAGFFILYLANKYGNRLAGEVYQALAGTDSGTVGEALNVVLKNHGTTPAIEWVNFLEVLEARPRELAGFGGKNNRNRAVLEADAPNADGKTPVRFTVNKTLAPHAQLKAGYLTGGENASLSATFELGGLSGDELYVSMGKDAASIGAFSQPGQMVVTVDAPEGAGVLVYGVSPNQTIVPLAGAPIYYLSYGDPMTVSGFKLFVENFSQDGSADSYNALILVPFNNRSTDYSSGEPIARITVNLWYWGQVLPLDMTPTPGFPIDNFGPTPTVGQIPPTDAGTSDHACAGMTLDKMRAPSVLNKRCWVVCFGIGSSTPSDSQILDCIAKHQ